MGSSRGVILHLSSAAYHELRQALDDAGLLTTVAGAVAVPPATEVLDLKGAFVIEEPEKRWTSHISASTSREA